MSDIAQQLDSLSSQYQTLLPKLDLKSKQVELSKLEAGSTATDFWSDEHQAKHTMQQIASLRDDIESAHQFAANLSSLKELVQLDALDENSDTKQELANEINKLSKKLSHIKTKSCLNGKYDRYSAVLSIHSGQGGTEAMDWASMLMRMYQKYFELKQYTFQLVEQSDGEEAGIKSATFLVTSPFAYGYLKSEAGTHRLVRLSPFNADSLRQTSFAGVEVIPLIEQPIDKLEIKPEELEWQFFRSGGKGGQNVNKVNTAVRLTHIPTGITVSSSTQRHQEQNSGYNVPFHYLSS